MSKNWSKRGKMQRRIRINHIRMCFTLMLCELDVCDQSSKQLRARTLLKLKEARGSLRRRGDDRLEGLFLIQQTEIPWMKSRKPLGSFRPPRRNGSLRESRSHHHRLSHPTLLVRRRHIRRLNNPSFVRQQCGTPLWGEQLDQREVQQNGSFSHEAILETSGAIQIMYSSHTGGGMPKNHLMVRFKVRGVIHTISPRSDENCSASFATD